MTDELPGLRVRTRESQAHQNVIQPAFELSKQVFSGNTLLPDGPFEIATELIFEDAVHALHLLFFAKLQAVSDDLRFTALTVLPRGEISLFDSTRRLEASFTFQEQLHAFATAQSTNRT